MNDSLNSEDRQRVPIVRHVVVISGFRQQWGDTTTGVEQLWWALHAHQPRPERVVWLKAWNDDFRALAMQIEHYRLRQPAVIDVIAYSWGVGHGMRQFAHQLQRFGLTIRTCYAIDGVYKAWLGLPVRSLFSRWNPLAPQIVIPRNVQRTIFWRQAANRPQGHQLTTQSRQQILEPGCEPDGLVAGHTHQTIDNSDGIHAAIWERINRDDSARATRQSGTRAQSQSHANDGLSSRVHCSDFGSLWSD